MGRKKGDRHSVETRRKAAEIFRRGHGYQFAATALSLRPGTVRKWHRTFISAGEEAMLTMGAHRTYSWETKCAAARAVVEGEMTKAEAMARYGVASVRALETWARAWREGGAEALRPKPRGRPRGSAGPREMTREQELERRIERLEAENAYLKKSIALKAAGRSRPARGPRS